MITSPEMGLLIWNLGTDPYNHEELAENWAKVDDHDHTPGRGKPITTGALADAAVTSAKLAPGSAANKMCQLYASANATISTGTITKVLLDQMALDTWGTAADTTNHQITIPNAGNFLLIGQTWWAGPVAGSRSSRIYKNGINQNWNSHAPDSGSGDGTTVNSFMTTTLAQGDIISLYVRQNTAGNLTLFGGGPAGTNLTVIELS